MQQSHVALETEALGKIALEFLDPNEHRCYMKPIVNQEEDSGEARSKRNQEKKGQRKRRRVSGGDDWSR